MSSVGFLSGKVTTIECIRMRSKTQDKRRRHGFYFFPTFFGLNLIWHMFSCMLDSLCYSQDVETPMPNTSWKQKPWELDPWRQSETQIKINQQILKIFQAKRQANPPAAERKEWPERWLGEWYRCQRPATTAWERRRGFFGDCCYGNIMGIPITWIFIIPSYIAILWK